LTKLYAAACNVNSMFVESEGFINLKSGISCLLSKKSFIYKGKSRNHRDATVYREYVGFQSRVTVHAG
jgi:hypothetical protein